MLEAVSKETLQSFQSRKSSSSRRRCKSMNLTGFNGQPARCTSRPVSKRLECGLEYRALKAAIALAQENVASQQLFFDKPNANDRIDNATTDIVLVRGAAVGEQQICRSCELSNKSASKASTTSLAVSTVKSFELSKCKSKSSLKCGHGRWIVASWKHLRIATRHLRIATSLRECHDKDIYNPLASQQFADGCRHQ